ncbi:MAG TPA: helicase [Candidatus Atribacteria bacterium]|nr:helicase [Candidatus Atribacteria bacterium]
MQAQSNFQDLTFITNENNQSLADRFKTLIKDTRFFDVLVGYFYTSGFYEIYKSLEKTEKIRILVGINTNISDLSNFSTPTASLPNENPTNSSQEQSLQSLQSLQFSHSETKKQFSEEVTNEMENSPDSKEVEEGVNIFLEWLKSGKLEIKAYPAANIHAKLYIMTFLESDRDIGRVITGSSNFTKSGLLDNFEFNVELKNRTDYEFALAKFNELWEDAVDLKEKYRETIQTKTWLKNNITPYELYLKFLYEYFQDDLKQTEEIFYQYVPKDFMKLEYQEQAVLNAKKILQEYGGVFLSDVVGLGKTYISALLAQQLDGRHLVIAPPMLLDKDSPGSWPNVFSDFKESADFESLGKLDKLLKRDITKYKNIFIDEAHRFRSETNVTYEMLARICRGKRVILVTATPYNNYPKDILSQIKLFQNSKKSNIPNLPNLENFFSKLEKRLKHLDRKRNYSEYIKTVKQNSREIREEVLKYLMIRRTRTEVIKYFTRELEKHQLKFPEVANPEPIFYQLNDQEDKIFTKTIKMITLDFNYSRYTPLLYYRGEITQPEELAQKNMRKFMKILLVKRLESSFYAFRQSINRFIYSYKKFLEEFDKGNVYVSKKYINKIFELLENDNDEAIQKLIEEDKAEKYSSKDFDPKYRELLEKDLKTLREIQKIWSTVNRDPKLLQFIDILSYHPILKKNKLIVFTESKETADYLYEKLSKYKYKVIEYTGTSSEVNRRKVIENFDPKSHISRDDYRILISTEVLSEGVNLHKSNVVINYDIPWNPTRMMQRAGRINRVDAKFDKIYTFNFFPSKQSNDLIKLKETAEAKINAFITLLGNDARLLTENEEIESHELFNRLTSKKTITGEDEEEESALKYLKIIKDIRDDNPDLFSRIKSLPKKARTARIYKQKTNKLLTYFRKGKLQKFFITSEKQEPQELDFITTAKILEVKEDTKREKMVSNFYDLLDKNKEAFKFTTQEEASEIKLTGGRDSSTQVLKILKALSKDTRKFTEEQEDYLKIVMQKITEGALPKQTTKTLLKELNSELKKTINPLRILAVLQKNIAPEFLQEHLSESAAQTSGPREVILSEYLIGE